MTPRGLLHLGRLPRPRQQFGDVRLAAERHAGELGCNVPEVPGTPLLSQRASISPASVPVPCQLLLKLPLGQSLGVLQRISINKINSPGILEKTDKSKRKKRSTVKRDDFF